MTVAARHDGRMTVPAGFPSGRGVRWSGPAAGAVLAMALIAGCSASQAGGGPGTATGKPGSAGPSGAASAPGPAGSGSAGAIGGTGAGGTAGSGGAGSGTQAGCTAWPAGSTRTILSITADSNGRTYCVRTGETVQILMSGSLALANGAQPPRLSGDALAARPARQAQMLKMPAESYTAVRPGTSALTIVRLPCHSRQMQAGPATSAPAAAGFARPAISVAAETAQVAGASRAVLASLAVSGGGVPVGTNCATQQVLRVYIVVS